MYATIMVSRSHYSNVSRIRGGGPLIPSLQSFRGDPFEVRRWGILAPSALKSTPLARLSPPCLPSVGAPPLPAISLGDKESSEVHLPQRLTYYGSPPITEGLLLINNNRILEEDVS